MPPARASAIARRASVTVSIAAETTGIASSSSRVSRVRVETSFGSTSDDAGTSRTSSKARPSRANLSSSARRRSTSTRPSSNPSKENSLTPPPAEPGRFGEPRGLRHLAPPRPTWRPRLTAVRRENAGWGRGYAGETGRFPREASARRRPVRARRPRRPAGGRRPPWGRSGPAPTSRVEAAPAATALAQRLLGRASGRVRGDERGQQHVAAADARDCLDLRRDGAVAPRLAALAQAREAAALVRDQDVARPQLGDVLERRRRSPAARRTPVRRAPRPRAGSARRETAPPPGRAAAARPPSRARSAPGDG